MIQDWANIFVRRLSVAQRKLGIVTAGFIPVGGLTGQVLAKSSNANYDVSWQFIFGGGGIITVGNGLVAVGNTLHAIQAAAYPPGAIPFASGATTLGFDAGTLFWDTATKRLGLGMAAPAVTLDVVGQFQALYTTAVAGETLSNNLLTLNLASGNWGSVTGVLGIIDTGGNANNMTGGLLKGGRFGIEWSGSGSSFSTGLVGLEASCLKTGTGAVPSTGALEITHGNMNAVGTVDVSYGIAVEPCNAVGPVTTAIGINIDAQASANVTTAIGFRQQGASDLNWFEGVLGVGMIAETTAWLALAASTTARSSLRFTTGVAPTNPVDGDTWYDSTQKCDMFYRDGIRQYAVNMLYSMSDDVSIFNTLVETTIFGAGIGTLTLPAGFWAATKKLRVRFHGTIADTGVPTGQVRVFLGATVVADSTAAALPATITGTEGWILDLILNCHVNGGAGVGKIGTSGLLLHHTLNVTGPIHGIELNHVDTVMDTTVSMTLDIRWTWGTANPANIFNCEYGTVEVIG